MELIYGRFEPSQYLLSTTSFLMMFLCSNIIHSAIKFRCSTTEKSDAWKVKIAFFFDPRLTLCTTVFQGQMSGEKKKPIDSLLFIPPVLLCCRFALDKQQVEACIQIWICFWVTTKSARFSVLVVTNRLTHVLRIYNWIFPRTSPCSGGRLWWHWLCSKTFILSAKQKT